MIEHYHLHSCYISYIFTRFQKIFYKGCGIFEAVPKTIKTAKKLNF